MTSDLYFIKLDFELRAPVLISGSVGDENMVTSEDYITGAAILGAFVTQYLDGNKIVHNSDNFKEFHTYFLSGKLQFLNGYPLSDQGERLLPIPRSIQVEKGTDSCKDILFKDDAKINEKGEKSQVEQTKYKAGYCSLAHSFLQKQNVDKQYQVHHQRTNQRMARSASGEIFNYESILPGQKYRSLIIGKEAVLEKFLKKFSSDVYNIRLGRSRQTQYGSATLTMGRTPDQFSKEHIFTIPPRNKKSLVATLKEEQPNTDISTLAVTFLSDIILCDDNGNNRVDLEIFAANLGIKKDDIKKSFIRSKIVESYISAWKTRTPSYVAFEKGSCFLIEPVDVSKFTEFEKIGIGIKRNEGYGRIAVNWQQGELIDPGKSQEEDLPNANQEKIKISDEVNPLVAELVKNRILESTQLSAASQIAKLAANKKQFENFCNRIKTTQIHKLRRFAQDSDTHEKFIKKLDQIPKSSREKLQEARWQDGTFWEFLRTDPRKEFIKIKNNDNDLQNLADLSFLDNENFQQKQMKYYYSAVFTLLAKRIKREVSNG